MAAEDFDAIEANAGTGGALFAMDSFLDASGDTRVLPFSAIVIPDGSGYSRITGANPLPVTGPLTDTQLRAAPVPVSGTFYQATQPVSAASLPLPAGAASAANQATVIAGLVSIDGHVDGVESSLSSLDSKVTACNTGAVVVTTLPALPAGTNVIGHVIVDSGSITVSGGLTDTQLRATPVPVSGTLTVNAGTGTFAVSGTFWQATQPVSLAALPALVAGAAIIGKVTTDQTTHGTTDLVAADITKVAGAGIAQGHGTAAAAIRVELPTDGTGVVILGAGTAVVGKVSIDQTTPGTTNLVAADNTKIGGTAIDANSGNKSNGTQRVVLATDQPTMTNPQPTNDVPATSGGLASYTFLSTAAVQAAAIKASPGQVYKLSFFNKNASPVFVRLYNQTGSPATTDAANILWRGMVPGNTSVGGWMEHFPGGLAFSAGIGIRVTAAVADNDGTVLSANDVMGNVGYK